MAIVSPRMHLSKWLVLMISIISMISNGRARARIPVSNEVTGFEKPKGTVKTIESHESGEVIDCVDINKQPAFDHPLRKNHTIQTNPSSNRKANEAGHVRGAVSQVWWKYGKCPKGTVPIRRVQNGTTRHVKRWTSRLKRLNLSENESDDDGGEHRYAIGFLSGGKYLGAQAYLNLWKPEVVDDEFSLAQIWVIAGPREELNTVEAGWMGDGYKTGCYNTECRGFVQKSDQFALGAALEGFSTYYGSQYELLIALVKDMSIGYWENDVFTHLNGYADRIEFGGEVARKQKGPIPTSTQMGSGHLPSEGFAKAAYFRSIKFFDDGLNIRDPENLMKAVDKAECYDVKREYDVTYEAHFYYGGPGLSAQCASY
ncbi:hypothetical protein EUGRSUZ_C01571 [Eucalyptus grandis]|uniref:Uncharacterized protein n=2 Tax=Eucalyptus grandis TaxID=71139 RepID=A0ACC3LD45_EUCGR|nr:hypothetical protein EUGRSUZ_C01571 [Eucalyptus grandis]